MCKLKSIARQSGHELLAEVPRTATPSSSSSSCIVFRATNCAVNLVIIVIIIATANFQDATCSRKFLTGLIIGTLLARNGMQGGQPYVAPVSYSSGPGHQQQQQPLFIIIPSAGGGSKSYGKHHVYSPPLASPASYAASAAARRLSPYLKRRSGLLTNRRRPNQTRPLAHKQEQHNQHHYPRASSQLLTTVPVVDIGYEQGQAGEEAAFDAIHAQADESERLQQHQREQELLDEQLVAKSANKAALWRHKLQSGHDWASSKKNSLLAGKLARRPSAPLPGLAIGEQPHQPHRFAAPQPEPVLSLGELQQALAAGTQPRRRQQLATDADQEVKPKVPSPATLLSLLDETTGGSGLATADKQQQQLQLLDAISLLGQHHTGPPTPLTNATTIATQLQL